MKMNDSGNIFTQFFAWVAALASAIGFTTQDLVFMFFGAAGLLISLASYINGRVSGLHSWCFSLSARNGEREWAGHQDSTTTFCPG